MLAFAELFYRSADGKTIAHPTRLFPASIHDSIILPIDDFLSALIPVTAATDVTDTFMQ